MAQGTRERDFALQVATRLREAGYQALWAGGCVRDQLLGLIPQDYDVATSARPEQVRDLFGHRRTLAIGAAFGVIVVLGRQSQQIEVATFRSDGAYLDGRHPTGVTYTTAEADAQRRDFTINGLFFDPVEETVIDYVGGQQDLKQGLIRAIGEPSARFSEDKLRMLRAVRFATTFDFQIDPPTLAAVQSMAAEVHVVSAERIGGELRRLLVHPARKRGLELLLESGLLAQLLPELAALWQQQPACWQQTLQHLDQLNSDSLAVALATLIADSRQLALVSEIGRSYRFTNKEIERASWLVLKLPDIEQSETIPWPKLQRVLVHEGVGDLMDLADAVLGNAHRGVCHARRRLALSPEELDPAPLLTGQDLIAHGVRPGPGFAQILEIVRDQQLLGTLGNRQEALLLVDQWLERNRGGS